MHAALLAGGRETGARAIEQREAWQHCRHPRGIVTKCRVADRELLELREAAEVQRADARHELPLPAADVEYAQTAQPPEELRKAALRVESAGGRVRMPDAERAQHGERLGQPDRLDAGAFHRRSSSSSAGALPTSRAMVEISLPSSCSVVSAECTTSKNSVQCRIGQPSFAQDERLQCRACCPGRRRVERRREAQPRSTALHLKRTQRRQLLNDAQLEWSFPAQQLQLL